MPLSCTGVVVLVCAVVSGCGGRTRSDFYRQKLTSEIRVLEDQLYEADYTNRVLRDDLERYRRKVDQSKIPLSPAEDSSILPDGVSGSSSRMPLSSEPQQTIEIIEDELAMPDFDLGEPVESPHAVADPHTVADPASPPADKNTYLLPTPTPRPDPQPLKDPQPLDSQPAEKKSPLPTFKGSSETSPQPPVSPEPPGKDDLKVDPLIPGEIQPPPSGETPDNPPGQIILPTGLRAASSIPRRLLIHRTLSMPLRETTGQSTGVKVILGAVDQRGNRVDWSAFTIEANLSIVVLDPTRPANQARLGRWDFSPNQIPKLISPDPSLGLEIPLHWQDKTPQGDDVIVHVRLRGDTDEMRCEGTLWLGRSPEKTASGWTPRGGDPAY